MSTILDAYTLNSIADIPILHITHDNIRKMNLIGQIQGTEKLSVRQKQSKNVSHLSRNLYKLYE